ncbi:adhesion G-protein coupled receptor G7 [Octodon degus]|uniref:Adhesion G-protein coupled receptor G7 n=1 Tax=Octodon degus TaxID=10160 RepID=A0A6P3FCB6_OCTDE|nr:adhesion G-protein coupled receptor G7 [Octodon degus]
MAACSTRNIRALVATVCGLLTVIILGLAIWRTVIRIQKGTFYQPSSTPVEFCRNGGTWANGRCICTEEWKGLRCTIANFCENSTYMGFTFNRIPVGRYGPSLQTCDRDTINAGHPLAIRLCSLSLYGEIELQNVIIGSCEENLHTLEMQIDNITENSRNISMEAQILTSDANRLTPENITSATKVVGQIFNESRNADTEAKKIAVTTVSQLLYASENVFQEAAATDDEDAFATLIEQMESYSLSLGNDSVVEPNIAVQSVHLTDTSTSVRFSVWKGTSDSLVSGSTIVETNVDSLNPDGKTELQILVNTNTNNTACGFVVYQNNKLFQSKIFTSRSHFSQKIISSKVDGNEQDLSASVKMVFSPEYNQKEFQFNSYACVYWNFLRKDWDTYGCHKDRTTDGFLGCHCNHTTNFAVLMTFKKNYQYPESLDVLSNVGCALSIAGLALTSIFQIVTRKVRKISVTWVLVNLCTSMLIFNLLFVFGIENSNKDLSTSDRDINVDFDNNEMPTADIIDIPNSACTATAAFLHYFLLVTFMWNGLSAIQLYFLLIRTMKPLPQHFILLLTLVGWGVPGIIVGVTLGVVYSKNGKESHWELDYRQEEITKKTSTLKKILSTLSIAVIFGITWIFAYFMLINNDDFRNVFSYIFCLFNTTQGLQIFILHTIRTKIFQTEVSKVLKSLSSSVGKMKPRSPWIPPRMRLRMYSLLRSFPSLQEHFRLLEPSAMTEERTLTKSDKENSSI